MLMTPSCSMINFTLENKIETICTHRVWSKSGESAIVEWRKWTHAKKGGKWIQISENLGNPPERRMTVLLALLSSIHSYFCLGIHVIIPVKNCI